MACRECEGKGMCEYCFNLGDTNPLQPFGIISKQEWDDAQAEITQLKEQLARTERERDQAIEVTELEECDKTEYPELYEHLWHLAELRNDLRAMRGE